MKKESWVSEPTRFILMHDIALYPYWNGGASIGISQWHNTSNPGKVFDEKTVGVSPDKFRGPVGFVDGHAQQCDFGSIIKRNPLHGLDPGKDWTWYKPLQ